MNKFVEQAVWESFDKSSLFPDYNFINVVSIDKEEKVQLCENNELASKINSTENLASRLGFKLVLFHAP